MKGKILKYMKVVVDVYRYLVLSRVAGHRFRALARSCSDDINCLVKIAFFFEYKHPLLPPVRIRPAQVFEEILEFAKNIWIFKPRYTLEIGTASGVALFLWCRFTSDDATVISIDLPEGLSVVDTLHGKYLYICHLKNLGKDYT